MPTINQTIQKIRSFAQLSEGWHYGEGVPVNPNSGEKAERFLLTAEAWGIEEANAFPGIDGEVELTFYLGDKTFAFLFELDGTVSITEERGDKIISDVYEQPYQVAEQKLWELSQKMQTIYVSFTLDIGTRVIKDLGQRLSVAHPKKKIRNAGSRSSQYPVYWRQKEPSASTSDTFTVPSQATRLSSCV